MHELPVRELMTRDVVTVAPDTTFKALVRVLEEHRVDAVPVVEGGRLLGLVSASDLTAHDEEPATLSRLVLGGKQERLHAKKSRAGTARELMTSPAKCIGPDATIAQALHTMARAHVGRLVVVDDGRVCGILTRADVLRVYLRDDAQLRDEVAEVLGRVVQCDSDVDVAVSDGVVELRGWVEKASCGWAAAAAISHLPGVVGVDDRLTYRVDDALTDQLAMHGPIA